MSPDRRQEDRRQADRRDQSNTEGKKTIKLSLFLTIIIFLLIIFTIAVTVIISIFQNMLIKMEEDQSKSNFDIANLLSSSFSIDENQPTDFDVANLLTEEPNPVNEVLDLDPDIISINELAAMQNAIGE